ncbi:TetR/AcrR family transcriptional regulator [Streptomyces sp. NBC_00286]|uniref:TetR/AcrR family transcriptional regulator n=1 Tax=Streptomyces sp. NBC_00286 TaxID=2975701 RepID=UPI002E2970BE|nr:TetR/AcrR family transcriptional regulator [Streptomyces sp. NBC_00286]
MATRRKEQAAQTEAALKEAARRVFDRQGYLATKITDITAEAGRAAGSFYSHFKSKDELLEALLLDWLAQPQQEQPEPGPADLSQRTVLRERVVAAYWRVYTAHRPEIRALHQAAMVNADFAQRLMQIRHAQLGLMRANLQQIADAGHTLPGDPAVVASAVNAMLEQFCHIWIIQGGEPIGRELEADEAIDTLTDLILRGITEPKQPES